MLIFSKVLKKQKHNFIEKTRRDRGQGGEFATCFSIRFQLFLDAKHAHAREYETVIESLRSDDRRSRDDGRQVAEVQFATSKPCRSSLRIPVFLNNTSNQIY
jgi:hypothetical protein